MPITYTLKSFDTNATGEISNLTTLTALNIKDIKFEQSVGDEMWLESGELTLETYTEITAADWIALYINDILTEVFDFRQVKYDEKRGKYTYNLFPIQKTFMQDCADTEVEYLGATDFWGHNLPDAEVELLSFAVLDGDGATQTGTDVSGYQPLRMVKGMIGTSNNLGYYIYSASFDGATITDVGGNKGTLIRGTGVPTSDTDQQKALNTFNGMNWFEIFKILSLSYNAFIKVSPVIVAGTPDKLAVAIDITPRENVTAGTAITDVVFSERVLVNEKYSIPGVHITGNNFNYTLGRFLSADALQKDVDLYDYLIATADWETALYYRGNGVGNPPWFNGGSSVDDYYSGLISAGHGYEGKCQVIYNDGSEKLLKVLDQVQFNSTVIMINRLRAGLSSLADYEGIIIN